MTIVKSRRNHFLSNLDPIFLKGRIWSLSFPAILYNVIILQLSKNFLTFSINVSQNLQQLFPCISPYLYPMSPVPSSIELHYFFFTASLLLSFCFHPSYIYFLHILINLFSLPSYLCLSLFTLKLFLVQFSFLYQEACCDMTGLFHTLAVLSSNFLSGYCSSAGSCESFFSSFPWGSALLIDAVVTVA